MTTQVINEQSALFLTFTFTDENGDPIVPSTIEWRLDDITNDTEVVGWTNIGSPATSVNVTISAQNNLISNQDNVYETRRVTVRIDEGQSTEGNQEKEYRIKNLHGTT